MRYLLCLLSSPVDKEPSDRQSLGYPTDLAVALCDLLEQEMQMIDPAAEELRDQRIGNWLVVLFYGITVVAALATAIGLIKFWGA